MVVGEMAIYQQLRSAKRSQECNALSVGLQASQLRYEHIHCCPVVAAVSSHVTRHVLRSMSSTSLVGSKIRPKQISVDSR